MGGWRAIGVVAAALGVALAAVPCLADPMMGGTLSESYSPTPFLPDTGTFDALLMDLGRPPGDKPHGMTTSNASLAVSANSPALAPAGTPGDLNLVTNPALNTPLADVPAGNSMFTLLAPEQRDQGGVKVKDLGRLVVAHDGPVQRTGRAVFGAGEYRDLTLSGLGALVSGGLIARLGTDKAHMLGVNPGLNFSFLSGTLTQSARFHCEPKLKNPGIDLESRYHLLHVQAPHVMPFLKDAFLEGGATVSRNTGAGLLPNRYVRLHLSNDHLDETVQLWDPPASPPVWSLDSVGHSGPYRLHLIVSRENQTGALGLGATMMRSLGVAQLGVYGGSHTLQGTSAGVLGMLIF